LESLLIFNILPQVKAAPEKKRKHFWKMGVGGAAMAASLRCLVLNASMEPISVVSAQRGLVLLLKERAMMLERAQVCVRAQLFVPCHAGWHDLCAGGAMG
jgi:hypothetical protein